MNPPRAPFRRFVRRGGGNGGGNGKRPTFFFKRNGITIPANTQAGNSRNARRNQSARLGAAAINNLTNNQQNVINLSNIALDSTFLRPEHYVAPEDALLVQHIALDVAKECPSCLLYFPREAYNPDSEMAKQIKALEKHYQNHVANYSPKEILQNGYFNVNIALMLTDEQLMDAWPCIQNDLQMQPLRSLAIFAVAMHSVATIYAVNDALSLEACNRNMYVPRILTQPGKIYARPHMFMNVQPIKNIQRQILDQMYCVRGTVMMMGDVTAKASWIAFRCIRCGKQQAMKQTSGYYYLNVYRNVI